MSLLPFSGYEEANGDIVSQYYLLDTSVSASFIQRMTRLCCQFSGEGIKIPSPNQQRKSIRLCF